MLAARDRRDDLADVDAVLDHGVARLVVLERDLVPDRDVALRLDPELLVVLHDPAGELLALFHAFHHDDADAIALFMHHEMNHSTLHDSETLFYSHGRPPPLPGFARCARRGAGGVALAGSG